MGRVQQRLPDPSCPRSYRPALPSRRGHRRAQDHVFPHLQQHQLDRRQAAEDIDLVHQSHLGDAEDPALERSLPATQLDAKPLFQPRQELLAVDLLRQSRRPKRLPPAAWPRASGPRRRCRPAWPAKAASSGPKASRCRCCGSAAGFRPGPRSAGWPACRGFRPLRPPCGRPADRSRRPAGRIDSICRHARGLTARKASPGGVISAFCAPTTSTSMPQASVRHSIAPTPLMPSTTSRAGLFRTTRPMASMSWPTPVLVSCKVEKTAAISGCCASSRCDLGRLEGLAPGQFVAHDLDAEPLGDQPPALGELARLQHQRLAAAAARRFTTAASMPPVPEQERMSTSLAVWKAYFSPSRHFAHRAAELGRAMVADLPGHGQQGGLGNFNGTGGEKAFFRHGREEERGAGDLRSEI